MDNRNIIMLYIVVLIFCTNNSILSQNKDINKAIDKIRKQYETIVNQKIENLKVDFIDLTYRPTEEESESISYGSSNTYEIYYNEKDTFLIKNYYMQDEGGAYQEKTTEVYLWNNLPFFFFMKTEGLWGGIREEYRIYLEKERVIRKLHKQATFYSGLTGYIDVSLDTIPNIPLKIDEDDYNLVIDFLNSSKSEINSSRQ